MVIFGSELKSKIVENRRNNNNNNHHHHHTTCYGATQPELSSTLHKTNNNKKDGYRQRNVRQFLSAISLRPIIWLPYESHAGMSLPSAVLRMQAFGYVKRV